MRPVLPDDLSAAARACLAVPPPQRGTCARRLVEQASAADHYCRRFGRAHPRWGNGTLMAAAFAQPFANEPRLDDPDYIDCLIAVLCALKARPRGPGAEPARRAVLKQPELLGRP